jgi:hypothetical protein
VSTINERLGKVVSASGLSKTAFAKRINVTQQYVSKMVVEGMPSDRTISDICREFGVDEVWLRHGEGEMLRPRSRKDAISAYMGQLLGNQRSEFEEDIIEFMANTRPEFWDMLIEELRPLAKSIAEKKPPDTE